MARCTDSLQRRRCARTGASSRSATAEFRYFAKRLSQLADPELVLLAEVDGQPAGFSITLPDINEAIRPLAAG